MTAEEKVKALRPDAFAIRPKWNPRECRIYEGFHGTILARHPRESWAWADAYRNLKSEDAG